MEFKLQILESSKKVPTKFIRYEDLSEKTFFLFKEIIQFINKITNNNEKIELSKS